MLNVATVFTFNLGDESFLDDQLKLLASWILKISANRAFGMRLTYITYLIWQTLTLLIYLSCPLYLNQSIDFMPLSPYENYTFSSSNKSGVTLAFNK
jgi:hypothetical protein